MTKWDLEYNKRRGGDFNKPNVVVPVSEIAWTFAGRQGDLVSLLAYAKNRRSSVDLLVELRDASGATLAAATSAHPAASRRGIRRSVQRFATP